MSAAGGKADIARTRTKPSGCARLFDPGTGLRALLVLVAGAGAARSHGHFAVDHDRQSGRAAKPPGRVAAGLPLFDRIPKGARRAPIGCSRRQVVALLLGYFAFGDRPDRHMLLGAGIIVLSGLYAFYRERQLDRLRPAATASGLPPEGV